MILRISSSNFSTCMSTLRVWLYCRISMDSSDRSSMWETLSFSMMLWTVYSNCWDIFEWHVCHIEETQRPFQQSLIRIPVCRSCQADSEYVYFFKVTFCSVNIATFRIFSRFLVIWSFSVIQGNCRENPYNFDRIGIQEMFFFMNWKPKKWASEVCSDFWKFFFEKKVILLQSNFFVVFLNFDLDFDHEFFAFNHKFLNRVKVVKKKNDLVHWI